MREIERIKEREKREKERKRKGDILKEVKKEG
jgi:hypothetical protein